MPMERNAACLQNLKWCVKAASGIHFSWEQLWKMDGSAAYLPYPVFLKKSSRRTGEYNG